MEIVVEPYPYPVSYKGEYHLRSGSTKQVLKGAALDHFLLGKQGKSWDGVPVPNVAVRALSRPVFDDFRKKALQSKRLSQATLREPIAALVDKLHLKEGKFLKRAALLLFHPDPEKFISGAFIKIGFFRSDAELLYHDEIHGHLFGQMEKAMDLLLTKYLKAGINYQGIQRVETFPVPESALREAVLNAVIHKDYAVGAPIQISVYSDRLMLWNPGELPKDWTVQELKGKHPSKPFNPDIANTFFRAGEIEAWGRGIADIFRACKEAGIPEPDLRFEESGLWVEFLYGRGHRASVETPVRPPVTPPVAALLRLLHIEGPLGNAEIRKHFNIKDRAHLRKHYLDAALRQGVIEPTLPDKPTSRLQQYRLTTKGAEIAALLGES